VAALITARVPMVTFEHFGSTAVPGCAGKGVVDLMLLYPEGYLEIARETLDSLGFQRQTTGHLFPESRQMRVGAVKCRGRTFRVHVHVIAATSTEVDLLRGFRERLRADPRVLSVQDITPDEAFARARSRPGLGDLLDLAGTNPFSEALEVRVRVGALPAIGAVVSTVIGDPAVDPAFPTSYDPQAYAGLRNLALGVGIGGAILVLLFGFISYAACANAIRAIALARKEEIALTRLLAARRWMVRGPFIVEGIMTGALGGVAGAALVAVAWWLLGKGGPALYSAVLPGVGLRAVEIDAAVVIMVGMALGAVASAFGVRRLTA